MKKFTPKLYWLIHHGLLMESTTEPIENRRAYIRAEKPRSERATRLKWLRPVKRPDLLPKAVLKADADRWKADADWRKADADWWKADADWRKAAADWRKADADWWKANADRRKANADRRKANADRRKADADWRKADADWRKAINENWKNIVRRHKAECPGCPFDYAEKTLIFS